MTILFRKSYALTLTSNIRDVNPPAWYLGALAYEVFIQLTHSRSTARDIHHPQSGLIFRFMGYLFFKSDADRPIGAAT